MELREALIQQSPSLALQRAAADEIARLDAKIRDLESRVIVSDGNHRYLIPRNRVSEFYFLYEQGMNGSELAWSQMDERFAEYRK